MESQAEIIERWTYLRDLLLQQLERFETGGLHMHADSVDVSEGAIAKLKKDILDFDVLIARSKAREGR